MNEIEIYKTADNTLELKVNFDNDTVWLSRTQMAKLFDKDRRTVSEHINNIFKEGELAEKVVCRKFRHTTQHGAIKGKTQQKNVKYYNLDVILSVGYRVNSKRGTQFRQWATQRLKDFLVKRYTINQKHLDELQQAIPFIQKSFSYNQYLTA